MSQTLKVLIVEDSPSLARTYEAYVQTANYATIVAETGNEAMVALAETIPDAIVLDLNLPDMHGLDILRYVREQKMHSAVVVLTAEASVNVAVEAMRLGADDFVAKPASSERLLVSLANAIEKQRLVEIAETYETIARSTFCDFIGQSLEMQAVYRIIENAASSKASVFITGESGTGKELAACAIHQLSPRHTQACEIVNCAAIPHNLLESEIFGHKKGSFTGAISNKEGVAHRADKGTLFLDELGEMPMELQSKLLRFIQSGTFTPVGGSQLEQVDVRFVSATNRNALDAVHDGVLREDLYYRLNVIPIHMPPLRERGDDILLLAQSFMERFSREEKKPFCEIGEDARDVLYSYLWPGNIRELENIIRNAVVLNQGEILKADMLSIYGQSNMDLKDAIPESHKPNQQGVFTNEITAIPKVKENIRPLKDIEKDVIEAAILLCDGNISEASRYLGINASTIHRKRQTWTHEIPNVTAS